MINRNIAIDGPAGAGKSTIAKLLSRELGYKYVDTGAMYRTVGLYLLRKGVDPADEAAVDRAMEDIDVNVEFLGDEQHVYLNGEDVTGLIRTEAVGNMASACSVHNSVREGLVRMQREIGRKYPVVMDGRDIGTVVLPDAGLKIFLTASPEERAGRRTKELLEKGMPADYDEVLRDIKERDYRDTHRDISPLVKAEDAVELITDGLDINGVMDAIKELIGKTFTDHRAAD